MSEKQIDKLELFTKERLEEFPDFNAQQYEPLLNAIRDEKLIVFYGAGVSMLGGCASWVGLAQNIIAEMPRILFSDLEKIVLNEMALTKAREVISICRGRVTDNPGHEKCYFDAIRNSVKPKTEKIEDWRKAHQLLLDLNPVAFITTNIDKAIESLGAKLGSRRIINLVENKEENFAPITAEDTGKPNPLSAPEVEISEESPAYTKVCKGNIFYLHGSINQVEKAILGIDQYIEYYYQGSSAKDFLREVFAENYTVLFIGYGLEEYEILQNIYLAVNNTPLQSRTLHHFVLTPLYTRDIAKFNIQSNYLKMFSVCPIPYFIDHVGYSKLFEVLENLIPLARACRAPLDKLNEIDSV